MKKVLFLVSALAAAPTVWAQSYDIKSGLPAEVYMTCADAGELAKTDSAGVAEVVAIMGNASVESRGLKIAKTADTDKAVIDKLNQVCAADPQMLLITAIDDTMRAIAQK
ncbi:YmgD family protein [Edwardsiella tarda]|uniref:YmgD family protein n=3 Tax=Edwardsiella tarda TaxID=636 RepID=A0A2A7U464_EDWTA|nr:YmgD family protein [Edwardsiella tarda]AKH89522.1 YmgD family protein [Edwardsiella tarda]ATI63155.1 hypothetical protein CPU03_02125 [Edwardsiella tarda]EFE23577.1 hypothetical protein EDWATA_01404 [Edwardsiella tarda ATCC 23685]PEH73155.1 hypothetical protein CRM76_15050 [Edwardsiella tarda]UAL57807.1 YmgD family protein [Edwardsiella tarda]